MLSLTIICLTIGVLAVVGSWITASAMIVKATASQPAAAPSSRPTAASVDTDRPLITSSAVV